MKEKGNMIISSLNATLARHFALKALNLFDAIVDPTGAGLFDTIQDALDAGAKRILLKDGTHTPTADITLTDQELAGESWNAILDLGSHKIVFKDGLHRTIAGAIEPAAVGTSLAGNGTNFSTITGVKRFSSFGGNFGIESVVSDTELELKGRYHGILTDDAVQASFSHQTFDTYNVKRGLSNMTILASNTAPTPAIQMSGVNLSIRGCRCLTQDTATRWVDCSSGSGQVCIDALIEECIFEGGLQAISLTNAEHTKISRCRMQGQYQAAIYFNDDRVIFTAIQNCDFAGCTIGISQSYGANTSIGECTFLLCRTAINIDTNATWIYNCKFSQCGTEAGKGAIVAGESVPVVELLISSCFFNKGLYAIKVTGSYLSVSDCVCQTQGTASIYCKANFSKITNNHLLAPQLGMLIEASYCIIANNFAIGATAEGIKNAIGSDKNIIMGNNAIGSGTPISDLGTNTVLEHNVIA